VVRTPEETAPSQNDALKRVMDHLLIERSLIDDSTASPERIDRYLQFLGQVSEGFHLHLKDPVDRAISWVFELALSGEIDPWNVDLVSFSMMYARRVQEETGIDLVVAGKIIELAWSIHRRKADVAFEDLMESLIEPEEELPVGGWDWIEDDLDLVITHEVVSSEESPLDLMVVHSGKRPVTLLELLDALKDAQEEAERLKKVREKREKLKKLQMEMGKKKVGERVFSENLEEDLKRVMSRINRYNGRPIEFKKIYGSDGIDLITAFVAILHLAKKRSIDVWQKSKPHGEIYILNLKHRRVGEGGKNT